jgi:hypothetical protein
MGFTLADAAGLTPHTARYLSNANEALAQGKRVLIVGSKGSNFEERLRKDSRFEFWDSTDPSTVSRRVPAHVGAMLFLKYLPHALHNRLCAEAEKLGFKPLAPLQSTGQVRKLLSLLASGGPSTATEAAPAKRSPQATIAPGLAHDEGVEVILGPPKDEHPVSIARERRYGQSQGLYKVVAGLIDLPREIYFGEIKREAERLLPLVRDAYPKVTVDDLSAAVYNVRKKRGDPPAHKTHRPAEEPYKRLTSTEIMLESVKLAETIEAEAVPEKVHEVHEVHSEPGLADGMEMLTQACTLFLKAAPLVIERLNLLSAEVEHLKAERDDYKERLDIMTEAITRPLKGK